MIDKNPAPSNNEQNNGEKKVFDPFYVAIYTGATQRADAAYTVIAQQAGKAIAGAGFGLVYGGGRLGLMGHVAVSAVENGAPVVGVTTTHLDDFEGAQQGLTELHIVENMHARKMMMFNRAHGFLVLPGGYGTLDEFFEVLVWRQIQLHKKPIILLNFNNYWDHLVALLDDIIHKKFARPEQRSDFIVCDTVESAISSFKTHFEATLF